MTIQASCHCGAVELAADRRPRALTECNCSLCRRYGARWAYYSRRSIHVRHRYRLTHYEWGVRKVRFAHCGRCGCVLFQESTTDRGAATRLGVNARMFRPEDVAGIPIRLFDGADTWKYL